MGWGCENLDKKEIEIQALITQRLLMIQKQVNMLNDST